MSFILLKNYTFQGANKKNTTYDLEVVNSKSSEVVVFMHGYMGYKDWGCWNLVQDYFIVHGLNFAKFNVSHNGTTVDNPKEFTDLESFSINSYKRELDDLKVFINHLKVAYHLDKIHLIGHSRGGGIVLLSANNPSVQTVSTWASICSVDERMKKGTELKEWKEAGFYYTKNGRTNQEMPHSYSQYEEFRANEDILNIEQSCIELKKPICVIHGVEDSSVSIIEGEQIASWTNSKLIKIDDTNHTFGASEPWDGNELPLALKQVCEQTLRFIKTEGAKLSQMNERNGLLAELIKMADADNSIRDMEFQFLLSISSQMGVTKDDFKELFEQHIEFQPPKLEFERIVQFQRLVLLMNVDMEIAATEMTYIKDLGIRMGLNPMATNEVLNVMQNYPNKVVPPDVLIQIFRTFHN